MQKKILAGVCSCPQCSWQCDCLPFAHIYQMPARAANSILLAYTGPQVGLEHG